MQREIPVRLHAVAKKMAKVGRTEYKSIRKPSWKEYTLTKYDGKKIISREKVWINESKIFPSDKDFFWESEGEKDNKKAA